MNYRFAKLAPIIGVSEESLKDAARLRGYRIVGPLLCLSDNRRFPVDIIAEARLVEKMRVAAQRRRPGQAA